MSMEMSRPHLYPWVFLQLRQEDCTVGDTQEDGKRIHNGGTKYIHLVHKGYIKDAQNIDMCLGNIYNWVKSQKSKFQV